jgi:hypothetical protein
VRSRCRKLGQLVDLDISQPGNRRLQLKVDALGYPAREAEDPPPRHLFAALLGTNPVASWVTEQARNLVARWDSFPSRFLIRDRDCKYSDGFDEVFRSEGAKDRAHADQSSAC